MYVISTEPSDKHPPSNYPYLLNRSLGTVDEEWSRGKVKATKAYESGTTDWTDQHEIKPSNTSVQKGKIQKLKHKQVPYIL